MRFFIASGILQVLCSSFFFRMAHLALQQRCGLRCERLQVLLSQLGCEACGKSCHRRRTLVATALQQASIASPQCLYSLERITTSGCFDRRLAHRHDGICVPSQCERALSRGGAPQLARVIEGRGDHRRAVEGKYGSVHPMSVPGECSHTHSRCGIPHFGSHVIRRCQHQGSVG